jgi:two-component system, NtrC family, sensor kinase
MPRSRSASPPAPDRGPAARVPRSTRTLPETSPGAVRRGSLRAEILFSLALLAAAGLALALSTATAVRSAGERALPMLAVMLAADVVIFVFLGRYLVDRHVVNPIHATVEAAEAIVDGDYTRRVPPGETREIEALSVALNRMTDQLLENQSRLAENVRSLDETNRALLRTQRELVQAEKLASIGRLAAGVAHEIGNPLGSLMGYATLLGRRGADPELVEGVDRESRRIDRVVRRLLDYARSAPVEREPVSVNESLNRVAQLFQSQGKLQQVLVQMELTERPTPILADPHLLDQVFVNLMDNACAAMPGGGRLCIATAVEEYAPDRPLPMRRSDDPPGVNYAHLRRSRGMSVRDAARIDPGTHVVRVTLADTGAGIAAEHLDEVFDPFFTTRAPGEGTGLGLAIVASTVAEFGGRVHASSRGGGGGAMFTLHFPLLMEDA